MLAVVAVTAAGCGDHHAGTLPGDASVDAPGDAPADAAVVYAGPPACPPIPPPPSLPPPQPVVAGTRLVPRTIADPSAGGFDVPWSVHDTLLDADCTPVRFFDRRFRCLPAFDGWQLGFVEVVFADVGQTIPVVALPVDRAPPPGTLVPLGQGVDGSNPLDTTDFSCTRTDSAAMRLGGRRTETTFWRSDLSKATLQPGFGLYDLSALPAGFVEISEVRVQLSGAIALRELHGADGSILFSSGLVDTAHDVPVAFLGDGVDRVRLVPPSAIAANGMYFRPPPGASDPGNRDACYASSDPIFLLSNTSACDVSEFRFISDLGNFEAPRYLPGIVHQVVKTDATLYDCSRGPVHVPLLQECAASALTDWTPASLVPVGGRITTPVWQIGDAAFAPPYFGLPLFARGGFQGPRTFHDTTLGVDCVPGTAADGVLRCLPLQGDVVFLDSACTMPVAATDSSVPPSYVGRTLREPQFPNDLRAQYTIFGVGAPRDPNIRIYSDRPNGICSLGGERLHLYELGPEIAASSLEALEIRDVPAASAGARAATPPRQTPPRRAAVRR